MYSPPTSQQPKSLLSSEAVDSINTLVAQDLGALQTGEPQPGDKPRKVGVSTKGKWKPRALPTLMTPVDYLDVPQPITDFGTFALRKTVKYETRRDLITIYGVVRSAIKRDSTGSFRPVAAIQDGHGHRIWVKAPPDESEALYEQLLAKDKHSIIMLGRVFQDSERRWWIEYPEPLPKRWLGRPRPAYDLHYQTRRALERRTSESITESYLLDAKVQNEWRRSVDHLEAFANYLGRSAAELLDVGLKGPEELYVATNETNRRKAGQYIQQVLTLAHKPSAKIDWVDATARIDRMAAVCVMAPQVREGLAYNEKRLARLAKYNPPGLPAHYADDPDAFLDCMVANVPFPLTDEQRQAALEIMEDLDSGTPMERVLSGDVGTGKTAVYVAAVDAMIAAGHRVGVMLPSAILALQTYEKLARYLPDTTISVVADNVREVHPDAPLWVGTVGIHSHTPEDFDFFVIDEQQRFSREQRERTIREGAHRLEVTATCIPRTQALLDANVLSVSTLKECHVKKNMITRVHAPDHKRKVFRDVARDVAAGDVVMVIYSGREEDSMDRAGNEIYAVKKYAPMWDQHFPGRVAVCHGAKDAAENQAEVDLIKSREKSILVATSIVEVGIDIEGVRRIIVVQPERFGLATLHQLRGRAARDGGRGYCDLMLVRDISVEAAERLRYMERTTDGFKLASYDLEIRGGGDATSIGHRQSGAAPKSPFKNRETPASVLSRIANELTEVFTDGIESVQSRKQQESQPKEA